jgi:hypothetical protein
VRQLALSDAPTERRSKVSRRSWSS